MRDESAFLREQAQTMHLGPKHRKSQKYVFGAPAKHWPNIEKNNQIQTPNEFRYGFMKLVVNLDMGPQEIKSITQTIQEVWNYV